jgi:glycosyltransferase involved in cell wall biosynthesis
MNTDPPVAPVSVVIPCYRCASTIGRAVDSIFAQSLIPAEIILVEDGSGDETLAVLQGLERRHQGQIRIVPMKTNCGAGSARNAGWATATQPYIAFLDADDSWHPDKLRIQYEYMRDHPDVALCGHPCALLGEGAPLPTLPENLPITRISANSLLFRNPFPTPAVMVKSDIQPRFQEGKRCAEDLLLWQQIAFAGLQVVRMESPLAYVHKAFYGAGGLSAQMWKMEKGELHNFVVLYRAGNIGWLQYAAATLLSIIKFFRRLLITKPQSIARASPRQGGST